MKYKMIKGIFLILISIFLNGCEKILHNSSLTNEIPSNKILFCRTLLKEKSPVKEICIMESDGSSQTVIRKKTDVVSPSSAEWAPDGKKIAFVDYDIENHKIYRCEKIYIIDYQGKNELVLTDDSLSCGALLSWSPNGKWISFNANSPNMGDLIENIYIMKSDGSNKVKITSTPNQNNSFPIWSPDGKNIAFLSYPNYDKICLPHQTNYDIYIVNIESKNLTQLTENPTFDGDISWSPDGKKIAYTSYRGNYEIFVMDIDTKIKSQLTTNSVHDCSPRWSPDGKKIAYVSDGMLYLMDPDGKNQVKLTDKTQCYVAYGVWSPDSKKIAFVAEGDIYTIDIDGKNLKNLTNTPDWEEGSPSWRPIVKGIGVKP